MHAQCNRLCVLLSGFAVCCPTCEVPINCTKYLNARTQYQLLMNYRGLRLKQVGGMEGDRGGVAGVEVEEVCVSRLPAHPSCCVTSVTDAGEGAGSVPVRGGRRQ